MSDRKINKSAPLARTSPIASTRVGRRSLTVFVEPEMFRRLKQLALDEGRTVQDVMTEAVGLLTASRKTQKGAANDA